MVLLRGFCFVRLAPGMTDRRSRNDALTGLTPAYAPLAAPAAAPVGANAPLMAVSGD